MRYQSVCLIAILFASVAMLCAAEASGPLLAHNPTMNKSTIVFSYAGDLWSVPRTGGEASRLTTGPGVEDNPIFSPDGTKIAFRGEYDGNLDVYVVDAGGGVPQRLTWHPSPDVPCAWTPDSKKILFRSTRASYSRFSRLYTVPAGGGFPSELELPMAETGVFSPDGKRIAYLPTAPAFTAWKRYRGGQTTRIWLADLASLNIEKLPR
jgi:tricorn protease